VKSLPNGKDGNSPASRAGFSALRNPLRKIVAMRGRNFKVFRQLAGVLGLPRKFILKTGIRNLQHRRDHSASDFPLTSATPYSVTKTSRRCRGMVSWP
jgi:hypothetical protein